MPSYTIVSLKFAAGLYKEMVLLQRKFIENNHDTTLFISNHYKKLGESQDTIYAGNSQSFIDVIKDSLTASKILKNIKDHIKESTSQKHYVLFYNSHPINLKIQKVLKKSFPKCETVVCLHEPYVPKEERKEFGIIRANYIKLILALQKRSIKLADKIICFSPHACELFKTHYDSQVSKLIKSNLLIRDPKISNLHTEKKHFLMVGTVNKNKALGDLIKAVNYQLVQNDESLQFQILTSSNIESYTQELKNGWDKILKVTSGTMLSDEEINSAIRDSFGVLVLHTTASQSGVIPLASSFGAPILCRKISAFYQYIKEEENLLSINFDAKELIEKCQYIKRNNKLMIDRSKELYDHNFSEDNFTEFYKPILTN